MAVLLLKHDVTLIGPDSTTYNVISYGEERIDGTWSGWLEFEPIDDTKPTLQTDQETSQPNRTAIEYWSTGLEPVYFEGAFDRAHIK